MYIAIIFTLKCTCTSSFTFFLYFSSNISGQKVVLSVTQPRTKLAQQCDFR